MPDKLGTQTLTRYVFERGDAAAVLLVDTPRKKIGLVRQFRISPTCRDADGWFLEIVAGSMDPHEDPAEVAKKEALEETAVTVHSMVEKGMVFLSPGGSTERCFLFFAEFDSESIVDQPCGERGTDEFTCVEIYRFAEIPRLITDGAVADAKTVIALQRLMLEAKEGI